MKNVWLNSDGELREEILDFCKVYFKDVFEDLEGALEDPKVEPLQETIANILYKDVIESGCYNPAFLYMRMVDVFGQL